MTAKPVKQFVSSNHVQLKVKIKKDVDLYSASHVQDTSNVHFVIETEPPGRYLGHRTACKHSPAQ